MKFEFTSYKENFFTETKQRKEKVLLIKFNCIKETKTHINDFEFKTRNDYD